MIGIGSIQHGPELRSLPVDGAILRIADLLRPDSPRPGTFNLEIVFEVPGRMGGPDYAGVKLGRIDRGAGRVQAFVAVPPDVARSKDPDLALVDLAEQAVRESAMAVQRLGGQLDHEPMLDLLREVRHEIAESGLAGPTPLTPDELEQDRLLAEAMSELGIGEGALPETPTLSATPGQGAFVELEIRLETSESGAVAEAFAFQDAIERRMAIEGAGFIDGNEVGDDEFIIFVHGPSRARLQDVVEAVLQTSWRHLHPTLQWSSADDEGADRSH